MIGSHLGGNRGLYRKRFICFPFQRYESVCMYVYEGFVGLTWGCRVGGGGKYRWMWDQKDKKEKQK